MVQIAVIDIVFSLDSVFTAVGLARPDQVPIMVGRHRAGDPGDDVGVGPISAFIERHPTIKILALAFLILVGVVLVAEASTSNSEGLPVLRHGVLGGGRNDQYPPAQAPRRARPAAPTLNGAGRSSSRPVGPGPGR